MGFYTFKLIIKYFKFSVNKWGASIYLYGPCLIILICCLIFFILTSKIINENDKDAIKVKELQHECPKAR